MSALMVPTQKEEGGGVANLQGPQVQQTLTRQKNIMGRRREREVKIIVMHRTYTQYHKNIRGKGVKLNNGRRGGGGGGSSCKRN